MKTVELAGVKVLVKSHPDCHEGLISTQTTEQFAGTLEGHTLAVEGALDEIIVRLIGQDAKCVLISVLQQFSADTRKPN